MISERIFYTFKPGSVPIVGAMNKVGEIDDDMIKNVFESVKVLGFETIHQVCGLKYSLCKDEYIQQIITDRCKQLQLIDKQTEIYLQTNEWLNQLNDVGLKKVQDVVNKKRLVLDALRKGGNRYEKIDIVGSWYSPSSPYVAAKDGFFYLRRRFFSDDIVLLTDSEFLAANKKDLNELDLSGKKLRYLHCREANLLNTDFGDSDITGADITNAEQEGLNICGTTMKDVTGFQLFPSTKLNKETKLPDEIACDASLYFQHKDTSLFQTNLSFLCEQRHHNVAIKNFLNDKILPAKIAAAHASQLIVGNQDELILLFDFVSNLDANKRITFIQKYPDIFLQILYKCVYIDLKNKDILQLGSAITRTAFHFDKEALRVHLAALELYGTCKEAVKIALQSKAPAHQNVQPASAEIIHSLNLLTPETVRKAPKLSIELQKAIALHILKEKNQTSQSPHTINLHEIITTLDFFNITLNAQAQQALLLIYEQRTFQDLLVEGVAELNNEGYAISLNTFELITTKLKPQKVNDINILLYRHLSVRDQCNLAATSMFNCSLYDAFYSANLKEDVKVTSLLEKGYSKKQIYIQYPPLREDWLISACQKGLNYLADKVLGPKTIERIEKGEMTLAAAVQEKKAFDRDMVEARKVKKNYCEWKERYLRDELRSESALDLLEKNSGERCAALRLPIVQFLVNSRQLTIEDAAQIKETQAHSRKKNHLFELLQKSLAQDWLKQGRLTLILLRLIVEVDGWELFESDYVRIPVANDDITIKEVLELCDMNLLDPLSALYHLMRVSQMIVGNEHRTGYTLKQVYLLSDFESKYKRELPSFENHRELVKDSA